MVCESWIDRCEECGSYPDSVEVAVSCSDPNVFWLSGHVLVVRRGTDLKCGSTPIDPK
jgi:hypothetical protein